MDLYGATVEDFAAVKVKNARHGLENPRARYRKEVTVEEVLDSPVVSDPLHLLDICATSDGGAAIVLVSEAKARQLAGAQPTVRIRGVASVTPTFPNTVLEMPNFATDSSAVVGPPDRSFMDSIAHRAYEQAGIGPDQVDYLCAHGTGTVTNDLTEVTAVREVFGPRVPPISSVKSMIGHTMGAASGFGAIACCLALQRGFLPPTATLRTVDERLGPDVDGVPGQGRAADVRIAQNHGFAFGGNNVITILGAL
jgi:3-oxoacyl-(acyl-carrier-protein) synthase